MTTNGKAAIRLALVIILFVLATAVAAEADYAERGVEGCLDCHDAASEHRADQILRTPHALSADRRTPFADQLQCETCHGPSAAHLTRLPDGTRPPPARIFDRSVPHEERSAACVGCHQDAARMHWQSSTHRSEAVACTDCHRVHVEKDPVLTIAAQPQVCFDCHQRQRAEFLRPSRHPVQSARFASRTGLMACSGCHNPHGGNGPAELVRNTVNETCYDCHAEMRGPFLWEHAPAREDCTNCHLAHGSPHEKLLVRRVPWLCQSCHLAQFHPSTEISGSNVPPGGRADLVLARGCMNCHTNVHGSNHPSGVRLTR
jgi:DmsE family decaheme c-type cytochrome